MSRQDLPCTGLRLCFPRVSGDEPHLTDGIIERGAFSPRERMSPRRTRQSRRTASFPRVSGDEPQPHFKVKAKIAFSPRERG